LHPNPQSVLVLGYGTGAAIEAAKAYAPSRIVCVDAQRALAGFTDSTARRHYMKSFTDGVEMHVERPAAYAARSADRYDVIISPEPFATPFKTRDLFSPVYYRSIEALLTQGGVFAQWVPVTSVTRDDMRRIIASVASAFSDVQLWLAHADVENAMLCIAASNAPVTAARMNRAGFAALQKNPDMAFQLRGIGLASWDHVLSDYCMDKSAALKFASDASPPSRFSLSLHATDDPSSPERWKRVFELFTMRTPPRHLLAAADDSLRMRAAAIYNDRLTVLRASASVAMGDDTTATRALFNANQQHPWNMEVNLALADILLRKATQFVGGGQQRQAMPLLAEVMKLAPLNTAVLRLMMIASMQLGDKITSGECIEGLKRLNPRHAGYRDNQATLRAQSGSLNDALLLYENAITIDPTNEDFYCNMASAQFNAGRAWEAIRILDRASEKAYYPAKAYALKGNFYLDRRRNDLAKEAYLGYLRVAMPDDPLRQNVLGALEQLNKTPAKQ
jgi:tetratricopeptide (TPR) repeat protein